MGRMNINFCDICGKRTDKIAGRLTLVMNAKTKDGYFSNKTVWGKALCKQCLNKMTATTTEGDKIRADIENYIDKRRLTNVNIPLLDVE